jgi:hypothetical protein
VIVNQSLRKLGTVKRQVPLTAYQSDRSLVSILTKSFEGAQGRTSTSNNYDLLGALTTRDFDVRLSPAALDSLLFARDID